MPFSINAPQTLLPASGESWIDIPIQVPSSAAIYNLFAHLVQQNFIANPSLPQNELKIFSDFFEQFDPLKKAPANEYRLNDPKQIKKMIRFLLHIRNYTIKITQGCFEQEQLKIERDHSEKEILKAVVENYITGLNVRIIFMLKVGQSVFLNILEPEFSEEYNSFWMSILYDLNSLLDLMSNILHIKYFKKNTINFAKLFTESIDKGDTLKLALCVLLSPYHETLKTAIEEHFILRNLYLTKYHLAIDDEKSAQPYLVAQHTFSIYYKNRNEKKNNAIYKKLYETTLEVGKQMTILQATYKEQKATLAAKKIKKATVVPPLASVPCVTPLTPAAACLASPASVPSYPTCSQLMVSSVHSTTSTTASISITSDTSTYPETKTAALPTCSASTEGNPFIEKTPLLSELEKEIAQCEANIALSTKRNANLEVEQLQKTKKYEITLAEYSSKKKILEEAIATLNEDYNQTIARTSTIQGQSKELKKERSRLEAQLRGFDATLSQLQKTIEELDIKTKRLSQEHEGLLAKSPIILANEPPLTQRETHYQARVHSLTQAQKQEQAKSKQLQQESEQLKTSLQNLLAKSKATELQTASLAQEKATQKKQLQEQIALLEQQCIQGEEVNAQWRAQCIYLEQQFEVLQQESRQATHINQESFRANIAALKQLFSGTTRHISDIEALSRMQSYNPLMTGPPPLMQSLFYGVSPNPSGGIPHPVPNSSPPIPLSRAPFVAPVAPVNSNNGSAPIVSMDPSISSEASSSSASSSSTSAASVDGPSASASCANACANRSTVRPT